MPKDTIERAIKKGSGAEAANLQSYTYEGYGPHGIAIYLHATSDNINRTVANVRSIFTKNNGSLGTNGSLSYVFETKGVFTITSESIANWDHDELELELIDGGAEEVEFEEVNLTIYTTFDHYGDMQSKLQELDITPTSTEIHQIPLNTKKLELAEAEEVLKIIDKFEEDDDIQTVFHNLELTEELIAQLEDN